VRAQVPAEVVLGWRRHVEATPLAAEEPSESGAFVPRLQPVAPAADLFESGHWRFGAPVDVQALVAGWAASKPRLVRAKGIVQALDGQWVSLQWAGRQAHVEPWMAPADPQRLGLVAWIALRAD
jgi:hypothetical protein